MFTEYSPISDENHQEFDIKTLLLGMKVRATNISTLVMNEFDQITRYYDHYDFGIANLISSATHIR